MSSTRVADEKIEKWGTKKGSRRKDLEKLSLLEKEELADRLEKEMKTAAQNLEFEKAAQLRDEIEALKKKTISR
ncbi:hypothetical protein GF337_16895, partial [candidate division KSB1 bacterium]|nr:hypothetical protein [candidate division KSB1 bacterium]